MTPETINITLAEQIDTHCLRLRFDDDTEQVVDFKPFLSHAAHPDIRSAVGCGDEGSAPMLRQRHGAVRASPHPTGLPPGGTGVRPARIGARLPVDPRGHRRLRWACPGAQADG